jgi:hypothetical protein
MGTWFDGPPATCLFQAKIYGKGRRPTVRGKFGKGTGEYGDNVPFVMAGGQQHLIPPCQE